MAKLTSLNMMLFFILMNTAFASKQIDSLKCNEYLKSKFGDKIKERGFKIPGQVNVDLKGKNQYSLLETHLLQIMNIVSG